MGREVRKVPADWEHPKHHNDETYRPLYDGLNDAISDFERSIAEKGMLEALRYHGGGPDPENYMPDWPEEDRTHFQMYEDTSEGTPISPVMESPEKLARWLADNGASSFGRDTATYEQWLPVCLGGRAPSMVIAGSRIISGVEAIAEQES